MSNLIPMDEAASMLGMTIEQLTELRSNNEIFGYKDGANWKFKQTELERVAGELNITLKQAGAAYEEDSSVELELPATCPTLLANIAKKCCQHDPKARPTMNQIAAVLVNGTPNPESGSDN